MLRLSMLSLVSALSCGVFGFGDGAMPGSPPARLLFFILLSFALACLTLGTLGFPEDWRVLRRRDRRIRLEGIPVTNMHRC